MKFILNRKIKYYTKEVFRLINLVAIALFIILLVTFTKFKIACEVTLGEEKLGYIADKEQFEQSVENYINEEVPNKEYTTIEKMPQYKVKLIDRTEKTNEEIILATIKQNAKTTYKFYAVTVDGKEKAVLSNLEEAEGLVKELSNKYEKKLNIKVGIVEKITTNNTEGITAVKTAQADMTKELTAQVKKKEQQEKAAAARVAASKVTTSKSTSTKTSGKKVSLNGVTLSVTPVSGIITSRFGSRESIRSSGHTGLDIGAPKGTRSKRQRQVLLHLQDIAEDMDT